ncbi:MAG: F420-0--gamma-glutamyl ligase [Candidatus Staskawiczbacteria bacterium]|nr:F420-0--gamma-glutamyl ligase [Candidatus Staskawiczbacteria bacterium]
MQENKNREKKLIIYIDGQKWERHLVKTHFIGVDDKFEDIVEKYVLPMSKTGDIVVLCQKIVSIIQKRIIYRKDVKVGFWARFLSKFVKKTPAGFSVGNPLKMQLAINLAGLPKIMLAAFFGFLFKIFRIRGMFYRIAGHQISEIDGFYGEAYPQYREMGILGPEGCNLLCDNLKKRFNFSFAVADVNDLGGNILGINKEAKEKEKLLLDILKDNPAGQSNQQTPIIIIRKND